MGSAARGAEAPPLTFSQIAATVVLNLLGLALPIVILQVYDRVIPNSTTETLAALLAGLLAVLVIDGLLRIARGHLTGWAGAEFEHRCLCGVVDTVLRADPAEIEAEKPGAHIDRVNAIDQLRDFYGGQGRLLLIDLPFLLVFLALFWVIAGPLVLIPVALFVLLGAATLLVGRAMRRSLEQRNGLDDRRYSFMIQVLSNIETVKALAMEQAMTRRYERLQLEGADASWSIIYLSGCAQTIGNISSGLTLTAVVAIGANQVIAGALTPGELAACTLLATRAVQPVMRALSLWAQYQGLAVALERVATLFELAPADHRQNVQEGGREVRGEIELRDVSFRDHADSPYDLYQANAHVQAGEIVAIVGDDSARKSTLLALIAGRLKPESGALLFDGQPEVDGLFLDPRQVVTVTQESGLFQGTILENLTLFESRDRLEDALAAASALGIDDEVHRLPKGYDTEVSTLAGTELSASLKQKLVIARALACHPKVLLLDEANTNLDQAGETLLRLALQALRGKTTVIMVTHRPSFHRIADQVLQLSDAQLRPYTERGAGGQTGESEPSAARPAVQPPPFGTGSDRPEALPA